MANIHRSLESLLTLMKPSFGEKCEENETQINSLIDTINSCKNPRQGRAYLHTLRNKIKNIDYSTLDKNTLKRIVDVEKNRGDVKNSKKLNKLDFLSKYGSSNIEHTTYNLNNSLDAIYMKRSFEEKELVDETKINNLIDTINSCKNPRQGRAYLHTLRNTLKDANYSVLDKNTLKRFIDVEQSRGDVMHSKKLNKLSELVRNKTLFESFVLPSKKYLHEIKYNPSNSSFDKTYKPLYTTAATAA